MSSSVFQDALKGKVAIVTGSTKGIGLAIAKKLLAQSAHVVVCGTHPDSIKEVKKELEFYDAHGQITFRALDVSCSDDVADLGTYVISQYGRIDILVNNAGIVKDQVLLRMTENQWDEVLDVNLKSVFLCTKMVLRHMIKARYGRIVNISSVVGIGGNPGQSNYSASKSGMIGFSKSVAKEVARKNITVNVVAPGFIETQMTKNLHQKILDKVLEFIPQSRFGKPEDVAELVYFLTSSSSSYITGEVIRIDGGMLI